MLSTQMYDWVTDFTKKQVLQQELLAAAEEDVRDKKKGVRYNVNL